MKIEVVKRGTWHDNVKVSNDFSSFKVIEHSGGCGSLIIYSFYGDITNLLSKFIDFIKDGGSNKEKYPSISLDVGMLQAVLGGDYYYTFKEKALLDNGFKVLSEYHNYRHHDSYMQKLYVLTIEQNEIL